MKKLPLFLAVFLTACSLAGPGNAPQTDVPQAATEAPVVTEAPAVTQAPVVAVTSAPSIQIPPASTTIFVTPPTTQPGKCATEPFSTPPFRTVMFVTDVSAVGTVRTAFVTIHVPLCVEAADWMLSAPPPATVSVPLPVMAAVIESVLPLSIDIVASDATAMVLD